MIQQEFTIQFESDVAEANTLVQELREDLLEAVEDIEVEQKRVNPNTQDLGTLLHLVAVGGPTVAAIAKVVSTFLLRHQGASITIKTQQGEVVATNVTTKDAMKLADLLLKSERESK